MTLWQRIKTIVGSLLTIFVAVGLCYLDPSDACRLIAALLGVALILSGIRHLFYYFTMARYMIGGKAILYKGILLLDFGLFTGTLNDIPTVYIILYLLACHAFTGAIDVLRALEAKKLQAPSWKYSMAFGGINLLIVVGCLVFFRSTSAVVYIYSSGLIYSALVRIMSAVRRSAIAYIP